jgi:cytosine/adenosine deaminase-related metal-dependent hydrolase
MVKEAVERCRTLKSGRCRAGLSPHAPYSTTPALLALSAREARRKRLPYTVHIAESALEYEMFTRGKGGMHDWLRKSGRDCSDCKLGTPVQQLERNGALNSQLLAVHVNYLGKSDAKLLGKRGVSVVHCPRSHGYFRHERFPFRKLHKARVNICLGTDSLASVYKTRKEKIELNMFEEMRSFAEEFPGVSSKQILRMATSNGARALGLEGKVGALENQAFADLISIPFTGSLRDAYDIVLHHSGEVADSFIGGKRVFGRG